MSAEDTGIGGTLKELRVNDLEIASQKNLSQKTRNRVTVVRKMADGAMRTFFCLFLCAFLTGATWGALCEYEIAASTGDSSALLSLELPAEALISLGGRPERLRILDRHGKTVPWLREQIMSSATVCVQDECGSVATLVREVGQGGLELHFELDENSPQPNGLSIETSVRNFEQTVEILGWENGAWHSLLQDGFIFDSSRVLQLRNVDVTFDSRKCRKFKALISRAALERQAELRSVRQTWSKDETIETVSATEIRTQTFKIERVRFWQRYERQAEDTPCWLAVDSGEFFTRNLPDQKQTSLELSPACFPVCGIRIKSAEANFSRKVRVLRQKGLFLAEQRLWAIDLPGYRKNHLDLHFSPQNTGPLLVIFQDDDIPPLKLQKIQYLIPAYRLLFFAEAEQLPCRLTAEPGGVEPNYGSAELIREALQKTTVQKATLLERKGDPIALQPTTQPAFSFPRWVLYLVLCLAVAALAWALIAAAHKNNADI